MKFFIAIAFWICSAQLFCTHQYENDQSGLEPVFGNLSTVESLEIFGDLHNYFDNLFLQVKEDNNEEVGKLV